MCLFNRFCAYVCISESITKASQKTHHSISNPFDHHEFDDCIATNPKITSYLPYYFCFQFIIVESRIMSDQIKI